MNSNQQKLHKSTIALQGLLSVLQAADKIEDVDGNKAVKHMRDALVAIGDNDPFCVKAVIQYEAPLFPAAYFSYSQPIGPKNKTQIARNTRSKVTALPSFKLGSYSIIKK